MERGVEGGAHSGKLFRGKKPLAGFKQLAFLSPDMGGKELSELAQSCGSQFAAFRPGKIIAQAYVLTKQAIHQRLEFGKGRGFRKKRLLFGGKVPADLQVEHGADLRLQGFHIRSTGLERTVNLHT